MLEQLTELREALTYVYQFIVTDTIKDIDEEPHEEIHRVKFRRVPSTWASVPMNLGCVTLLTL